MTRIAAFWLWVVQHWKAFGITITIPTLLAGVRWFYTKYRAQREKRLDSKVLDALGNHVWPSNRPFTGGGESCIRASEIADLLNLNPDAVADSLERLEIRGRVKRTEGDVPPNWFIVRR